MSRCCALFFSLYWRSLVMVITPFALLPVFLMNDGPEFKCLYVLLIMAIYWICEAFPMAVVGLIPIIAFPLLGIMDTYSVCHQYMKPANMVFVGGMMMALSLEYCGLSTRVALNCILLVGTSHRRLHFGISIITMFLSFFISNLALTPMMLPIINVCLSELEANGIGQMYTYPDNYAQLPPEEQEEVRKPTHSTIAFYLTAAYSTTIGGMGTVVGAATNIVTKGIYEAHYQDDLKFMDFSAYNIPPLLILMLIMYVWLQFLFLGLFRPNSKDGQLAAKSKENEALIRRVIQSEVEDMGGMSFHEIMVVMAFITGIVLYLTRHLGSMPGWMSLFNAKGINDAVTAAFLCVLYFVVPARLDVCYVCAKDKNKRPRRASGGLLTWSFLQKKTPWGVILLLGSGFALAKGMKASGLSKMLGEIVGELAKPLHRPVAQLIVLSAVSFFTEFTANVAVNNIFLPTTAEICKSLGWHPAILMIPAGSTANHAFLLPVATPPNALVAAECNMPVYNMIAAGSIVKISALLLWWGFWYVTGERIWSGDPPPVKTY